MTWRRGVLIFAAVLFLWQLGGRDLWAPDEPYFAEGAREMLIDGEWAVPHVNGVVTTDKPPLFFWLIALFSLPLGAVNEWTARLPSALAGLGTVALTMRLGARWYGPRAAALAGVLLSTTFLFWHKARWSQTDALLCFLIWVALSAFEAYRGRTADGTRAGLLFWLAAALAVLDKGPVGFLLPLGIALSVFAWDRQLRRWRGFAPFSGPLVFAAVIGAWIALATTGGQGEYSVWAALKEHFIDRGIEGLHHKQPPWYFLETLPVNLLPWTGLAPGALVLAWRRRRDGERLAFVAIVFVVLFFSISTEKRELYALPAFPAFALLAAGLVAAVCGWGEPEEGTPTALDRRWLTVGHGLVGGLLLVAALALGVIAQRQDEMLFGVALVIATVLAATAIGSLYLLRHRRAIASLGATAAGVAIAFLAYESIVTPVLEPRKSARSFAVRIKEVTAGSRSRGLPVVAFALGNLPEPFAFYSDGVYTLETRDPEVLLRHLERPEAVFAVANGDELPDFPSELRDRLRLVDSTRLARRPVLLLTNANHPEARPWRSHATDPSELAAPSPD